MKRNIYLIALAAVTVTASCKKETTTGGPVNPSPAVAPTIEWSKNWGGTMNDYSYASVKTPDGGIIVAGSTMSDDGDVAGQHGTMGTEDLVLIKYNAAGEKQWQKLYGGSAGEDARAVITTADGGYLISGKASSRDGDVTSVYGGEDVWVIKVNAAGEKQWQKTYGGFQSDYARCMAATPDGGYVIAGASMSSNGNLTENKGSYDWWVIKINSAGALQWQKSLGSNQLDEARAVAVHADGTIMVAGYVANQSGDVTANLGGQDLWVVKFSPAGAVLWKKNFGGSNDEMCTSMAALPGGGFILAGINFSTDGDITQNKGNGDMWLLKIDADGNKVWQKTFGGSGYDIAHAVSVTPDGSILAAGKTFSNDGDITGAKGNADGWLIKLNSMGVLQWQKTTGGSQNDDAYSVQAVDNNTCFITGSTNSENGDVSNPKGGNDCWAVKVQVK